jgi:hypothetical protein
MGESVLFVFDMKTRLFYWSIIFRKSDKFSFFENNVCMENLNDVDEKESIIEWNLVGMIEHGLLVVPSISMSINYTFAVRFFFWTGVYINEKEEIKDWVWNRA